LDHHVDFIPSDVYHPCAVTILATVNAERARDGRLVVARLEVGNP
jgi:hypothetical protein